MSRISQKDVKTFLSTPVQRLLVDSRDDHLTSDCNCIGALHQLTFNWDGISHLNKFFDHHGGETEQQRYQAVSEQLWPIILECERKVQGWEIIPVELLEWTNCVDDIQLCFSQLQNSKSCIMPLKIVLHLSSVFEHALGNVYRLKEKNIPFLLRDLLSSTQLIDIFGNLPMLVAKTLLGTPLAFNLRNICWHGFPAPDEICKSVAATLLVLFTSFGELLNVANISSIPYRSKIGTSVWASFLPNFESMHFPQLKFHHSEVIEFLENFGGIPKTHQLYWTSSFQFFCSESYGESLLLLLPALEHTLRCAFCSVNDCPKRMLVAEQHVLYTTMDEILDQNFMKSENFTVENQLPPLLGDRLMDMLMDMFCYFGGPRIRDKLSHGECKIDEIPAIVANHLFCMALLVLHKLGCEEKFKFSTSLLKVEENYSSKFHSISLLKCEVVSLLEKLTALNVYCKPNLIISEIVDFQTSLSAHVLKIQKLPKNSDRNSQIEFCLKQPLVTLFRNKLDLAHVSTLRKIIAALYQASKNCLIAVENRQSCLTQHALRSRQRASYFRMLEFMPSFQVVVECLVLIVLIQLLILPDTIVNLKFIKNMQKYVDNISSLSCLEKNRWTEMQEKTSSFCHTSMSFFKT